MVGIYKITNPKGKVYIGKSIDINKRLTYYKHYSHRKTQHKLNNSISKYGFENHTLEIIEECDVDREFNKINKIVKKTYAFIGEQQQKIKEDNKNIEMDNKKDEDQDLKIQFDKSFYG